MLKILSWNIRQGGGSRLRGIRSYLCQSGAQILVLSEYRNNMNGINLRHSLLLNGYRHQAVTASKSDENSVLIVSKLSFNSTSYIDIDPTYYGNVLKTEFPAFSLYGCYLPHKKKHNLFDFLLEEASVLRKPIMIAGDLNSGINHVDQAGDSFWYEHEMKALFEKGVKDAFRLKNGDIRDYSWVSHQGNGYRYDHTLASEDLHSVISGCYYDHEVRESGLSDHSAMILEMG